MSKSLLGLIFRGGGGYKYPYTPRRYAHGRSPRLFTERLVKQEKEKTTMISKMGPVSEPKTQWLAIINVSFRLSVEQYENPADLEDDVRQVGVDVGDESEIDGRHDDRLSGSDRQ